MKIEMEWPMEFPSADGKDYTETMFDIVVEVSKGDPGDRDTPGTGPESEIIAIVLQSIKNSVGEIDLDPILWPMLGFNLKVRKEIEDKAIEMANRKAEDEELDRADYLYERHRDERLDRLEDGPFVD